MIQDFARKFSKLFLGIAMRESAAEQFQGDRRQHTYVEDDDEPEDTEDECLQPTWMLTMEKQTSEGERFQDGYGSR